MEEKKRLVWIDVAKGIGMILVVLGYCVNKESVIHNWIFSFHMPLFFLLSGYCFKLQKYEKIRDVVREKSKTLLVPYVKFWILGLLFSLIVAEWRNELTLRQIMIDIYSGYPSSLHITSTWYLIALLMCEVIFYIIIKLSGWIKKRCFSYLCIGLSGIMGYMISVVKSIVYDNNVTESAHSTSATFLPGNRLPLTLDTCMTAIVFFAIGYWLRKYRKEFMKRRKRVSDIMLLGGVNIVFALGLNTRVNLHGCTYGNGLYFYIAALSGVMMIVYLSQIIEERQDKVIVSLRKCILFYGKNSLLMLGMQSLGINIFVYVLNQVKNQKYILYENVPLVAGGGAFVFIVGIFLPIVKRLNDRIPKKIGI